MRNCQSEHKVIFPSGSTTADSFWFRDKKREAMYFQNGNWNIFTEDMISACTETEIVLISDPRMEKQKGLRKHETVNP